jgi:hypothetical protein
MDKLAEKRGMDLSFQRVRTTAGTAAEYRKTRTLFLIKKHRFLQKVCSMGYSSEQADFCLYPARDGSGIALRPRGG